MHADGLLSDKCGDVWNECINNVKRRVARIHTQLMYTSKVRGCRRRPPLRLASRNNLFNIKRYCCIFLWTNFKYIRNVPHFILFPQICNKRCMTVIQRNDGLNNDVFSAFCSWDNSFTDICITFLSLNTLVFLHLSCFQFVLNKWVLWIEREIVILEKYDSRNMLRIPKEIFES